MLTGRRSLHRSPAGPGRLCARAAGRSAARAGQGGQGDQPVHASGAAVHTKCAHCLTPGEGERARQKPSHTVLQQTNEQDSLNCNRSLCRGTWTLRCAPPAPRAKTPMCCAAWTCACRPPVSLPAPLWPLFSHLPPPARLAPPVLGCLRLAPQLLHTSCQDALSGGCPARCTALMFPHMVTCRLQTSLARITWSVAGKCSHCSTMLMALWAQCFPRMPWRVSDPSLLEVTWQLLYPRDVACSSECKSGRSPRGSALTKAASPDRLLLCPHFCPSLLLLAPTPQATCASSACYGPSSTWRQCWGSAGMPSMRHSARSQCYVHRSDCMAWQWTMLSWWVRARGCSRARHGRFVWPATQACCGLDPCFLFGPPSGCSFCAGATGSASLPCAACRDGQFCDQPAGGEGFCNIDLLVV